jgi:hypothetical protein
VAGGAELAGELADPVGEALRVVEHDNVGHWSSLCAVAAQRHAGQRR